jgi:hypothetical protein
MEIPFLPAVHLRGRKRVVDQDPIASALESDQHQGLIRGVGEQREPEPRVAPPIRTMNAKRGKKARLSSRRADATTLHKTECQQEACEINERHKKATNVGTT